MNSAGDFTPDPFGADHETLVVRLPGGEYHIVLRDDALVLRGRYRGQPTMRTLDELTWPQGVQPGQRDIESYVREVVLGYFGKLGQEIARDGRIHAFLAAAVAEGSHCLEVTPSLYLCGDPYALDLIAWAEKRQAPARERWTAFDRVDEETYPLEVWPFDEAERIEVFARRLLDRYGRNLLREFLEILPSSRYYALRPAATETTRNVN